MGGGNTGNATIQITDCGLSPRGRGKLRLSRRQLPYRRSIPAWAGETPSLKSQRSIARVYPRVGGGNCFPPPPPSLPAGLSPRGRGKLSLPRKRLNWRRSIPAWAGETLDQNTTSRNRGVYPRVGGGNIIPFVHPAPAYGLSPRGRGKLPQLVSGSTPEGSIPAWAGETLAEVLHHLPSRVYPRVGGGNLTSSPLRVALRGLSPRGRGKPGPGKAVWGSQGSIPAWAGETLYLTGNAAW